MKKISILFVIFLLMITIFSICVQATTPTETENEIASSDETMETGTESSSTELIGKDDTVITTYGKIVEVGEVKENVTDVLTDKVQPVVVEIIEGDYIGEEFSTEYVLSYDIEGKILAQELDVGDKVTVQISEDSNGKATASVVDVVRANYIIGLVVIFLLSIVLVGGKKGIKAILGLLYTIVLIYMVMIKGIYNGENAVKMSLITCGLVVIGTFIIIGGGLNKKIITAALGTFGGVLTAGIVSIIFNNVAKMTGAYEDALQLSINSTLINFNFKQILFAGILISTLGACMDVGMSIASSLDEIKQKNPEITWKELFKSGMNIGRDVIGTMTNTLILAYVGSSLTLILLFLVCNMNLYEILNKETIAEEVVTAIAGSMGVVYTVPITSFIYSILNKDRLVYNKVSENKINGKRSLKI